jgi:deoxyuridine 5'-triphosphate nucleotidohydrolase
MSTELLRVKKLTELAILPSRGSKYAAGFDLSSAYDIVVPSRGKAIVKTDLAIAIPPNTYARIAPRSGLAAKNFIDVGAGVVDYDYRGNVGVVLFNHAEEDFTIKRGDRVAQLILERISMADMEEVQELPDTERGVAGFGSTGINFSAVEENAAKKARLEEEEQPVYEN